MLAFLLFLSGLEIDVARLRGRILRVTVLAFALSFGIAIIVGLLLKAGGFVQRHASRISVTHPAQVAQAGIRRKQQRADTLELQPTKLI